MYKLLKMLMIVAEKIGVIEGVTYGPWLKNKDRIEISGETQDGKLFDLVLEVETKEPCHDS